MKLSREKIQRMVGAELGGSAGGGGGESMGGFATQAWVDNNYVSIEWFDQIFQVFDDSTKLDVNGELPVDQSKMNIKAMFGFWTDFYLSALGNGGQVGASIYLSTLADVNVAGVQLGQVLTWKRDPSDGVNKWMADDAQSGVDMTTVWNALAASTNEQINASHLSTALTGYATQTWVGQQGYLTSSSLNGYATQTWVGQNYISIAYFDRLFRAYNGNTLVSHNDTATTIDNIKAMFGFWTDFYISALGNGGQVGASIYLSSLADVNVAGVQLGQVLTWKRDPSDGVNKWMADDAQSGVDMTTVWNALAASTNEQINASHLSTALTGYATQTWVGQQGFLTSTDISDMATQTWVGNNYLPLTGGTLTGALGVSGRLSGSGDDEGIVITPASNGFAGLILGGISGRRSVFYLDNSSAFWRYCSGEGSPYYDIKHPNESGTIALQSWVSDAYLPLTGGTLTGALQVNATIFGYNYTNSNNAAAFIFDKPGNNYTGIGANAVNDQIYFGACDQNGAWISDYAQKWYFNGSIQSSGSLQAESVKIEHLNEINSQSGMLHLNYRVATNLSLVYGGGSVGIGTYNPSYKLHVDGVIYSTTGVYSAGYVTALSDEREKNIIEDFEIPLDFIAKAPIVSYEWKDKERRGDKQHIGSIAQYWLREMPELVPEVNGRYTMDYGRIALLSAITVARTVVNHEQRLRELERRLINN